MLRGIYARSEPMNFGGKIVWGRKNRYTTQSVDPVITEIWVEMFRVGKPPEKLQLFFPLEMEAIKNDHEVRVRLQDWFALRAKESFPSDVIYIRFWERTTTRVVWPSSGKAEVLYGEFRDPSPNFWVDAAFIASDEGNLRDRFGTVYTVDASAHANCVVG